MEELKSCIYKCEECSCVFDHDVRKDEDGEWGHICNAKKYKKEHRCESYLYKYVQEDTRPTHNVDAVIEELRKYFQHQVDVGWVLLADNPDEMFDYIRTHIKGVDNKQEILKARIEEK